MVFSIHPAFPISAGAMVRLRECGVMVHCGSDLCSFNTTVGTPSWGVLSALRYMSMQSDVLDL